MLLEAIARPWYIEPQSASYYASLVHKLFAGETITDFNEAADAVKEFAWAANASGQRISTIEDAVDNGVAVINVRGAIMKYDYCGAAGTQSMIRALNAANNNPSLSAIVLQIDSPGGSVDGTQQFAEAIKQSKKPVVAYVNGMMCSAAMWIGSAAAERIASSNTDIIGSIGTMARWMDFKEMYARAGVKTHEVYASNSTQKNEGHRAAEEGNYEPLITGTLDPMNDEFTAAIQQNIPNVDKSVLSGNHYVAKEAKKKGLINKIGSFETAVRSAIQLSKTTKQNTKMENTTSPFQNTLVAATADSFAVVDGGFLLTEENLNAIETNITSSNDAIAALNQNLSDRALLHQQAEEQLGTATATIAERDATIEQLNERIATLEAGAAGSFSNTAAEKDNVGGDASAKYLTSYDKEMQDLLKMKNGQN